ncbi:hypothetical protein GA0111570_108146 [Raineyella antarctica]|uniref:Uncharacterized protein n=1 Tax=Raineyella antarctica TaxID=1577474 RepID=A0A1G6HEY3_9ACTN|nr:hypothetical protein [Raineyella antarctica]SDB92006.1 hypothetical protein GA0111570_108146 [Raineyella antarctica]
MTVVIRIAWVVFGLYQLLMALGSFPFGLLGALAFWGAAAGTIAFFAARSVTSAYVAGALSALGPFLVNTSHPQLFGPVYLTVNLLVAILMAWLAFVHERRRVAGW